MIDEDKKNNAIDRLVCVTDPAGEPGDIFANRAHTIFLVRRTLESLTLIDISDRLGKTFSVSENMRRVENHVP